MDFKRKKITRALLLLSKQDISRFRLFLKSSYFVKPEFQPILLRLFEILHSYAQEKDAINLDQRWLYEQLYPEDRFIQGKVDKIITRLTALLLQFLGIEGALDSNATELETLRVLREKGISDLWISYFKSTKKKIQKAKGGKEVDSFEVFQLDLENFRFQNQDPLKKDRQNYSIILESLDRLYRAYALEIGIQVLAYNKFIFPLELEKPFNALKMMLLEEKATPSTAGEKIKVEVFRLLSNSNSAHTEQFAQLRNLLQEYKSEISGSSYNEFRTIARNLAIHLYNLGDLSLEPLIFNMYKDDVEARIVFYDNKISAATVNNITTIALRQQRFDWLESFLDQVEHCILEDYIESFTLSLNRAKILFFKGVYEGVLDTLEFEVQDVFLKINSRILEVMTHYELQSDQLNYKIEAFKIFIYRLPNSKASAKFIKGNNNFIDILKSICHPKTSYDYQRIQKIKAKIIKTDLLAEKSWILGKIEELEMAVN